MIHVVSMLTLVWIESASSLKFLDMPLTHISNVSFTESIHLEERSMACARLYWVIIHLNPHVCFIDHCEYPTESIKIGYQELSDAKECSRRIHVLSRSQSAKQLVGNSKRKSNSQDGSKRRHSFVKSSRSIGPPVRLLTTRGNTTPMDPPHAPSDAHNLSEIWTKERECNGKSEGGTEKHYATTGCTFTNGRERPVSANPNPFESLEPIDNTLGLKDQDKAYHTQRHNESDQFDQKHAPNSGQKLKSVAQSLPNPSSTSPSKTQAPPTITARTSINFAAPRSHDKRKRGSPMGHHPRPGSSNDQNTVPSTDQSCFLRAEHLNTPTIRPQNARPPAEISRLIRENGDLNKLNGHSIPDGNSLNLARRRSPSFSNQQQCSSPLVPDKKKKHTKDASSGGLRGVEPGASIASPFILRAEFENQIDDLHTNHDEDPSTVELPAHTEAQPSNVNDQLMLGSAGEDAKKQDCPLGKDKDSQTSSARGQAGRGPSETIPDDCRQALKFDESQDTPDPSANSRSSGLIHLAERRSEDNIEMNFYHHHNAWSEHQHPGGDSKRDLVFVLDEGFDGHASAQKREGQETRGEEGSKNAALSRESVRKVSLINFGSKGPRNQGTPHKMDRPKHASKTGSARPPAVASSHQFGSDNHSKHENYDIGSSSFSRPQSDTNRALDDLQRHNIQLDHDSVQDGNKADSSQSQWVEVAFHKPACMKKTVPSTIVQVNEKLTKNKTTSSGRDLSVGLENNHPSRKILKSAFNEPSDIIKNQPNGSELSRRVSQTGSPFPKGMNLQLTIDETLEPNGTGSELVQSEQKQIFYEQRIKSQSIGPTSFLQGLRSYRNQSVDDSKEWNDAIEVIATNDGRPRVDGKFGRCATINTKKAFLDAEEVRNFNLKHASVMPTKTGSETSESYTRSQSSAVQRSAKHPVLTSKPLTKHDSLLPMQTDSGSWLAALHTCTRPIAQSLMTISRTLLTHLDDRELASKASIRELEMGGTKLVDQLLDAHDRDIRRAGRLLHQEAEALIREMKSIQERLGVGNELVARHVQEIINEENREKKGSKSEEELDDLMDKWCV